LGNVTRALIDAKLWDNTLVVFTTDNGGWPQHSGNNYPLRGGKVTYWEGGVRGVSFIQGKGVPANLAGTKSNALLHATDWLPTLVTVSGGKQGGTLPLDGYDQWAVITQGATNQRTEVLHNIDQVAGNAALRVGDWKILTGKQDYDGWYPAVGPPEIPTNTKNISLFNIANDPNERTDLSASNPAKVQELLARLDYYKAAAKAPFNPPADPDALPIRNGGVWGPWQ